MAQFFMRVTKLTPSKGGCAGRARYIFNEAAQENILLKSDSPVDWGEYDLFEKTEVRRKDKVYKKVFDPKTKTKVRSLVDVKPCVGRDNLHVHIIHSERHRQPPTGKWTRDIYFTDKGIQARNANERAKDKNGNDLPPVHRKGDDKGCFSLKDAEYASGKWLENTNRVLKDKIERLGYCMGYYLESQKYFTRSKLGRGKTHDKNGKLTRYGRVKKENEVFDKAEDLMETFETILNYKFPDNSTNADGKHTPEFSAFRAAILDTLRTGYSIEYVFRCHGKEQPKAKIPQPAPPAPAITKAPIATAIPTPHVPEQSDDTEAEYESKGKLKKTRETRAAQTQKVQ
jgi:hypothetical protein